jgi:hypothetical protein
MILKFETLFAMVQNSMDECSRNIFSLQSWYFDADTLPGEYRKMGRSIGLPYGKDKILIKFVVDSGGFTEWRKAKEEHMGNFYQSFLICGPMALHPRLGATSGMGKLEAETVRIVFSMIIPKKVLSTEVSTKKMKMLEKRAEKSARKQALTAAALQAVVEADEASEKLIAATEIPGICLFSNEVKFIARRMREVVKQAKDEFSDMKSHAEYYAKAARFDAELVDLASYSGGKPMGAPSWGEQDQEELFRLYGRRPPVHRPRVPTVHPGSYSSSEEDEEDEEDDEDDEDEDEEDDEDDEDEEEDEDMD